MVHKIQNVVIAGAGIMGASIARLFASFQYRVTLYDISREALDKSRELISADNEQGTGMAKEALAEGMGGKVRENIVFSSDKECFGQADFVIEAIVEKMEIKHRFFEEISRLVPEGAVLTSNTSGLSLTEIAKAVHLPERFCGMHWLNPPHICPLIEVIKGQRTRQETADIVFDVARDIRRYPVRLQKEVPGFLINRFQFAILREAMALAEEGVASREDIDNVFKYGLGLRYACLGPFEIADLGGLDTFYHIADYLFRDLSDAKEVHRMLADLYRKGDFGVKSGKGFYDYGNGRDREVIHKRDMDFQKVSKCLYGEMRG